MKKMKKVFAALAASAIAISMGAFAGCGATPDNSDDHINNGGTEGGAISGDYEEKTPDEITDIVEDIQPDKIFGDLTSEDAVLNLGIKVDLDSSIAMGELFSSTASINLDYKISAMAESFAGAGTVSLESYYMSMMTESGEKEEDEMNVSANLYNDVQFVYAETTGDDGMKVKINMEELFELFGIGSGDIVAPAPASVYDSSDAISVADVLAMAQQFGVSVAIDDSDGIKVKLSATEDTVWKAIAAASDGNITDTALAEMKELVTFNTFKFDVYFALDSEGAFAGASVVIDIDVKADPSLLNDIMPADGESSVGEMPEITATISGSIEISTHNDTVKVPESVSGSSSYVDMTETILNMIKDMM